MLDKKLADNPMPVIQQWMEHARKNAGVPNSHAMALSCCRVDGGIAYPSTRMVLLKHIELQLGYIVFYTNYQSRKGLELLSNERASALLFWDNLGRQVRMEGRVIQSPVAESDAYFSSRDRESKIGAWASAQSQPIESKEALLSKLKAMNERFADKSQPVPRPPHWGGFRLWIEHVELWEDGAHRLHDRAVWTRALPEDDVINTETAHTDLPDIEWHVSRLQP